MANTISITATQRNGAYGDVIRFLDDLSTEYGSATNAAAALLRSTERYRNWVAQQKGRPASRRRKAV